MMMSNLPDDLLEEILCRVPATSLTRLRSTCTQWNRLVNDSKFARKHNDKAAKQFLLLMVTEKSRVFSLSMNLHGTPSVEATGELSLIHPEFNSNQVNINKVFHCDGLLLCIIKKDTRIVVWNPCTGQTKCIQTSNDRLYVNDYDFVLGYYQDNKSGNKSYKILGYERTYCGFRKFKIYDISSGLWRNLDVTSDCHIIPDYRVSSLKGKTYWFADHEKEEQLVKVLLSFDYKTERFERLRLPYQFTFYASIALSVVREEKLSVLLQRTTRSMKEIWVTTNEIDDETKVMSWSKLFAVEDSGRWLGISFMVEDEEKKAIVCYEKKYNKHLWITTLSIVEEDNKSTQVDFPVLTERSCQPKFLVNYIPSLN